VSHSFRVIKACPQTGGRAGELVTAHGIAPTPVFVPVGSQATIKTLDPADLKSLGVSMVLGNTYHLYLRPGIEVIKSLGGLHRFMGWPGPLLTDSGGYQIFSLAPLREVNEDGVRFRSHIDGSEHFLTPERAIQWQEELGTDIMMTLDECPAYGEEYAQVEKATRRTHRWAERCLRARRGRGPALYGIVQGGTSPELRRESADLISSLDFEGIAIGGLSLGEPKGVMWAVVRETVPHLPQAKPRYLMGVGSPEDLVEGIGMGIDIFDSALPTRVARNGALFTSRGRCNIRNARFREQAEPVEPGCTCYTCRTFSAAYLHHLFRCEELLAYRLATIHNLHFILRLMEKARGALLEGTFLDFQQRFLSSYEPTEEGVRLEQRQKGGRPREAL